jgi:hypothetical protein
MNHLSHRLCIAPMMDRYDLSALARLSGRSCALGVAVTDDVALGGTALQFARPREA